MRDLLRAHAQEVQGEEDLIQGVQGEREDKVRAKRRILMTPCFGEWVCT